MRDAFKSYCYAGAIPSIVINKANTLTVQQYVEVLKRIKKTISRKPLSAYDDTTPGCKNTECNWGLCGESHQHYPTPELHRFPQDFVDNGRISALEPPEGFDCPMRERREIDGESLNASGCFYQCRVFQRNRKTPTREEALALYDAAIAKAEQSQEGGQ